jgi:hypothetical protein
MGRRRGDGSRVWTASRRDGATAGPVWRARMQCEIFVEEDEATTGSHSSMRRGKGEGSCCCALLG